MHSLSAFLFVLVKEEASLDRSVDRYFYLLNSFDLPSKGSEWFRKRCTLRLLLMCLEVEGGVLEVALPGDGINNLNGERFALEAGGRRELCFLVNLSNTLG